MHLKQDMIYVHNAILLQFVASGLTANYETYLNALISSI